MKSTLTKKLLLILIVGLIVLAGTAYFLHDRTPSLLALKEAARPDDSFLFALDSMRTALSSAEEEELRYLLVGGGGALKSYRLAREDLRTGLAGLTASAGPFFAQETVGKIESRIQDRFPSAEDLRALRRKHAGRAPAVLLLASGNRTLSREIESLLADLQHEQLEQMASEGELLGRSMQETVSLVLVLFGAALATVLLSLFVTGREFYLFGRTKHALQEFRELFSLFADGVKDCSIVILDGKGRIRNWNAGAEHLQGFPAREMLGKHFSLLYSDEEVRSGKPALALERALSEGRLEEIGWRARKQGSPFLAQCVITPLRDRKEVLRGYAVLTRDITEVRRSENLLQKFSASVEQAADLVIITDRDGSVEYANKAVEDITGFSRDEFLRQGLTLLRADDLNEDLSHAIGNTVTSGRPFESTVMTSKKDGTLLYLNAVATPIKDITGAVTHIVFTGSDVTNVKTLTDRLDYLASYDVTTGLPNRTLFSERLSRGCSQAGNRPFAVLAIDIDRFKVINEIYGFDAGNNVLKQVAESLAVSVSKGDTVGRLGSDEFGILYHDIARPADAVLFVKMIMKNVPHMVMSGGDQISVTLDIGIALYPADGTDAASLMKNAHTALSRAKSQGRNTYQFYTADMNVGVSELVLMERRLVDALRNKEYVLSYQPYCNLTDKSVAGMEALIKWNNDEFGIVSPTKFIPMLEETGMIIDVGKWVLRTACRQLQAWNNGRSYLPVSVNLSLSQFRHEHLVEMVEKTVREHRIEPRRLTLEVTESIFMKDLDFAISVLRRLKSLGVQISIDDFGTGYSSLSYLKRFPVDSVKIDQSFVNDVTIDPDTTALVTAIIAMAHSLNLKTIAEGVETEEQWKILRLLKCDMGQGFYFSPAMAPAECENFLKSGPKT